MTDPIQPSPHPPKDDAPLASQGTPVGLSPVVSEYVKRKLEQRDSSQWRPSKKFPVWASILLGVSASSVPALMAEHPTWQTILASVLAGAATGTSAYFGMLSAGQRK